MGKIPNHLHRYKRVNLSTTKGKEYLVFKCQKPACAHYVGIHLAEGKLCECNICGEPMILDKLAMTLAKPHCRNCTKKRNPNVEESIAAINDFLKDNTSQD